MGSRLCIVLLAVAIGFIGSATTASATADLVATKPPGGCEPRAAASRFSRMCARGGTPSERCCASVAEAVERGGVICLCWIASEPSVLTSGYGYESVVATYTSCGGAQSAPSVCTTTRGSAAPDGLNGHRKIKRPAAHLPVLHHHHHPKRPHAPHRHRKRRPVADLKDENEDEDEDEDDEHDDRADSVLRTTHPSSHPSSLRDKLEVTGIVIVVVVVPAAILALVCYVVCAGPGNRLARAQMIIGLLNTVLDVWRGGDRTAPASSNATLGISAVTGSNGQTAM